MIGRTFSHYRIEEKLGEGGMGVVFKAKDLRLDRPVALKFLPPHLVADHRAKDRFLLEAKAASALDHPNVCVIYEIDETQTGELFIAMAHYAGETLAEKLRPGPLSVQEAVEVARQVAAGLSKAHERGIIHRDIKPANLLRTEDGIWKILDFGIAKLAGEGGLTRTGGVVGTVAYMSPEQAGREEVSPQSDLWSLGVVLYEMLTGCLPFQGATPVASLYQILHEEPDPIREIRPDVPAPLARIVNRALAKDLGERYPGMAPLLDDLGAFAGVAAKVERPAEDPEEAAPEKRLLTPPPFLTPLSEPSAEAILLPFVAREQELGLLDGWLGEAVTGRARVGFIAGEAGAGKTALAREFYRRAVQREADLIVALGECNAHTGTGDSYRPFREILAQLTGDVEAQWAAGSMSADHATRLWGVLPTTAAALVDVGADLLGTFLPEASLLARAQAHPFLTGSRRADLHTLAARQVKPGTVRQADLFEQYVRVLRALAGERPLLLVVDDLQWADDGSIRLLFELGHHLAGTRILVLGLYRTTEVALGRGGERHPLEPVVNELAGLFGEVVLELGASADRHFVDALIDAEPNHLSPGFREGLFKQAGGQALFTVELLGRMKDQGLVVRDEAQRWVEGTAPIDWSRLPARVDAVIGERIARLTPDLQQLLMVASVEGEQFTLEALGRVQGTEPGRLLTAVNQELGRRHQLVAPEGLRRVNGQRLSIYRFRHNLFQRHLYHRLNEIERAHLHEQVGEALESLYHDHADDIALDLARHFRSAGLLEKASAYFFVAGQQAERSLAPADALADYESGLEALLSMPPSEERDRRELPLQQAIGNMRLAVPAPGVADAFARAQDLAECVGTIAQKFWATCGLYWVQHYSGQWDKWHEVSQRCLSLARDSGDPVLLISGLFLAEHGAYYSGDLPLAIAHGEEFLDRFGSKGHWTPMMGGFDVGATAVYMLGQALFKSGYPAQGLERFREAVAQTREANDPVTLQCALAFGAWALIDARDFGEARLWAEDCMQAQAESGEYGILLTFPLILRGWCDVMLGRVDEGLNTLREGVDGWAVPMGTAFLKGWHAVALSIAGRDDEGRLDMEEAMVIPQWNGPHVAADVQRLYGDLLAGLPEPDLAAAEAAYRKAIEIARGFGNRTDELNATTSLARLLKAQGRIAEARDLLGQIYGWFTEGHELPYLVEARELLEELGGV